MDIRLIAAPYFHGRPRLETGLGPERLLDAGAVRVLTEAGHVPLVMMVEPSTETLTETRASFEVVGVTAKQVARAVADGALPVVLAGNCNTACLGTLAGLAARDIGIVWFDGHGDFNTPETTLSGFFDGMALAMVVGDCWRALCETIPGLRAVPADRLIMIGARDFDERETQRMNAADLTLITPEELHAEGVAAALAEPLADLRKRVSSVYVHVDLDVLDPSEGRANRLAVPKGLTVTEVTTAIDAIGAQFTIAGAGLTAYDPTLDGDGRLAAAAGRIATAIAGSAAARAVA